MTMVDQLIKLGRDMDASDLHLIVGEPPVYRLDGALVRAQGSALTEQQVHSMALHIAQSSRVEMGEGDWDVGYADIHGERQRVNVFQQQGTTAIAMRFLNGTIPTIDQLKLPPVIRDIADYPRGLVLVTGPTGSGKSTTLAAMIDHINKNKKLHILTMEDPIEYVHENQNCVVNQREIGSDAGSFAGALRSALRQDPDIILVGEMRDRETISAALTAAETGHLVLSTLHTTGAAKTIDRIIDSFEPYQQQQVRTQVATVLKAVISQQLMPKIGGGRIAAHEIMLITDAVANMIREGKVFQIATALQTGAKSGMINMDATLARLVRENVIAPEIGLERCISREEYNRYTTGKVV